ncbi:MAG: immunity 17 family protein [Bacteroides sp.]|nr:immunity 17 family protein [Bacteroides sp.]
MLPHYLIQLLFALTGLLSLLAALLDWDWFFTARNTQWAVRSVGRRKARLFYAILGLLLLATAIFFFLQTTAAFR